MLAGKKPPVRKGALLRMKLFLMMMAGPAMTRSSRRELPQLMMRRQALSPMRMKFLTQDASHVDNGQGNDPYTDSNAKYGIYFAAEEDGTGHWYICNYDTDKRIRIDDLGRLSDAEATARKSAAAAGRWRAIACILIVTQILTIVLLLMLIRSLSSALKKQNKPQITGRTNPKGHRRQGSLAPQDDPAGNLTITRDEDLDL